MHLLHRMNVKYNELIKRNEHMRCYIEIDIDRFFFGKAISYMHIKIAQMCFCRRLGNHMWTSKGTTIDSIVEEGEEGGAPEL